MILSTPPTKQDYLDLCIRAYVESAEPYRRDRVEGRHAPPFASEWSLVFDTETMSDAGQQLRFGTFQVRKGDTIWRSGLFHETEGADLATLSAYSVKHGTELLTRETFVKEIFYGVAYDLRAKIIGFNLPFDLSRIAIAHGSARRDMRSGFSLKLTSDKRRPAVQVKHLYRRAALIRFAAPFKQRNARSERKRGERRPMRRGFFIDVHTAAGALYSRSFSLASLCAFLKTPNRKLDFEEFEGPITPEMIDYALMDVQATWDCYQGLAKHYAVLGLKDTPLSEVYSEASIGKGYLKAMGIKPWREVQTDIPSEILAAIMASYYGGRSEIRIRREIRQVVLCDFLSMYPTVCTLMGLWKFVVAEGMAWQDAAWEAQELLETLSLADLRDPAVWRRLTMLVQIDAKADILPARAKYGEDAQATIGLNFLSSDYPLWFTLADCVASKLLTGKAPRVLRAISFSPKESQPNLRIVCIGGDARYRVNPKSDDFYKRMVEFRQAIKIDRDMSSGDEREDLDVRQAAVKIAVNATSYGCFVEMNVKELACTAPATVHSASAQPYPIKTDKREEPGRFFHPLLATLTTGAARLMLAITERLIVENNLEWSFCDTDSMAIARPDYIQGVEFTSAIEQIITWFAPLNPYKFGGTILKVESQNFELCSTNSRPLYCWAISAKRYALFNLDNDRRPIIRKASAHGLGHLRAPYDAEKRARAIPRPKAPLGEIGVELWQHDLWWKIINAAINGNPEALSLDYHPALKRPAVSRYSATTPRLLRWFSKYNANRPYAAQVKPFNFMLSLFADATVCGARNQHPRPVAPFDKDHDAAMLRAFDRERGVPVPISHLKAYRRLLSAYHLQPENKFRNGDYLARGRTERRHVIVSGIQHIGKEANRWEEQSFVGFDKEAQPYYGQAPEALVGRTARVRQAIRDYSLAAVSRESKISPKRIRAALTKGSNDSPILSEIDRILPLLETSRREMTAHLENARASLISQISELGLRGAARKLGTDPSNLRRKVLRMRAGNQAVALQGIGRDGVSSEPRRSD